MTSLSQAGADLSSRQILLGAHVLELPAHLLDLLPIGVYVCDPDGVIIRYNQAATKAWGRVPAPDSRFCGAHRLHHPDGQPIAHAASPMATVLATGVPVRNLDIVMERMDGSRITATVQIDAIDGPDGQRIGAVCCFEDITERQQSERAAQRLAAIVEFSDDAILAMDLRGIITNWNQGAERLFGYTPEDIIGKPVTLLIPPDRLNEERHILSRIRGGDRIAHYETIRRRKDGSLVEISLTVSPVKNARGRIVGASKIGRDITLQRRAQEQQQLLLKEMDHRVKNLFALASGVVSLSARSAKTPAQLAAAVRERLGALALAHSLTLPGASAAPDAAGQATTLHALIQTITAPFDDRQDDETPRVTVRGADLPLAGSAVTSFALLLHEFATNAAKYGALSTSAGSIAIDCLEDGGRFTLIWQERGGPAVMRESNHEGFGSLLARITVQGQLGGEIVRQWEPDGLILRLSVDRSRVAA